MPEASPWTLPGCKSWPGALKSQLQHFHCRRDGRHREGLRLGTGDDIRHIVRQIPPLRSPLFLSGPGGDAEVDFHRRARSLCTGYLTTHLSIARHPVSGNAGDLLVNARSIRLSPAASCSRGPWTPRPTPSNAGTAIALTEQVAGHHRCRRDHHPNTEARARPGAISVHANSVDIAGRHALIDSSSSGIGPASSVTIDAASSLTPEPLDFGSRCRHRPGEGT